MSLSPTEPIHAMRGSQDGSLLFCAHQRPSITLWDIQTGGLIHTFTLKQTVSDIAISLGDRYLACRLFDSTIKREVATKMECPFSRNNLQVTHLCWLDPEEKIAVTLAASVHIRDIASAKVLRLFKMLDSTIRGMVYSQRRDELIILTTSSTGSTINIIHPLRGSPSTPRGIQQSIYCFAFSRTSNQLVCGTEKIGLELSDTSTQLWRHFEYPSRITSVSFLSNGTVVAGVKSSGIQVLSLDNGPTTSQQPILPILTVHTFDQGRIIPVLPTSRDHVVLFELATMSPLS